jgi:hypothetical protein
LRLLIAKIDGRTKIGVNICMSFEKNYPNRKDKRKRYRGSKAFDRSCRNHGKCDYCREGRLFKAEKRKQQAEAE